MQQAGYHHANSLAMQIRTDIQDHMATSRWPSGTGLPFRSDEDGSAIHVLLDPKFHSTARPGTLGLAATKERSRRAGNTAGQLLGQCQSRGAGEIG